MVDEVIKTLIKDICRQCLEQGEDVSETLAAFVVRWVLIHPDSGFFGRKSLNQKDVRLLIEECVRRLTDSDSISLATLQMQAITQPSRVELLEMAEQSRIRRCQGLLESILMSDAATVDEEKQLYDNIVKLTLIESGVGRIDDASQLSQATVAVGSVFPRGEVRAFLRMDKGKKKRQLQELYDISTGIRLYNWHRGKCTAPIRDIPGLLDSAVNTLSQNVEKQKQLTLTSIYKYTAILDHVCEKNQKETKSIAKLKESLIHLRQYHKYLRKIESEVNEVWKEAAEANRRLCVALETLQEEIGERTAVLATQIYPVFIEIAQLWKQFEKESFLVSHMNDYMARLIYLQRNISVQEHVDHDIIVLTDEERNTISSEEPIPQLTTTHCTLLAGANTSNMHVQLGSYCAWTLARYKYVVPGNAALGLLCYLGNYYAFSSSKAAQQFAENPEMFRRELSLAVSQYPGLLTLLGVDDWLLGGQTAEASFSQPCVSMGVQTELHPLTSSAEDYQWNEWVLRKEGLDKLKSMKKTTSATQTQDEATTQTRQCLEITTQTKLLPNV